MLPDIDLLVLDIDGCIIPHFDIIVQTHNNFYEKLAFSRGLDSKELKLRIQKHALEAKEDGQNLFNLVYNDIGAGLHHFPFLLPLQESDKELVAQLNAEKAAITDFFDHFIPTLAAIAFDEHGNRTHTKIALLSDGQEAGVVNRLSFAVINSQKIAGFLPNGFSVLDLIDRIYCLDDPFHPLDAEQEGINLACTTRMAVIAKTEALPPTWHKPNPQGLQKIMADFGIKPEHTLMIGDTARDIQVAIDCGAHHAWQKHGADLSEDVLLHLQELGDPTYKAGVEAVTQKLQQFAITTHHLDDGLINIFNYFAIAPRCYLPVSQSQHSCKP
ncbi:MAG: HAD family hydrolase [Alphaproteobacteria bacterium]